MPEASEEMRSVIRERFGSISDEGPVKYLEANGYKLTHDYEWFKPGVTELKDMTREEFDCLLFLAHEWDFSGLAGT